MMAQQNSVTSGRATKGDVIEPLEYTEIMDADLRITLQRCEDRILSYTQDMTDSLLSMAGEFRQAKDRLTRPGVAGSQWARWVARFRGISRETADRLAEIGKLERTELEALRSGLFAKSGGIAGIAAYLTAPADVQEQVKSGEVPPQQKAIAEAARAFKEAEEARQRAEEAERRARQAQANFESQVQEVKREALLQGQLELEKATSALQREVDEARHQALLRQRDMEEAQRQIQRAQTEWNQRVADVQTKATQQERERLERDFAEKMRLMQRQLEDQRKAAMAAQREANELNERLTNSRDSEAIRARWDVLAASLIDTIEAALLKIPSVVDAQYFESHERTLVESVRKRAEMLTQRMAELDRGSMTVVESRP